MHLIHIRRVAAKVPGQSHPEILAEFGMQPIDPRLHPVVQDTDVSPTLGVVPGTGKVQCLKPPLAIRRDTGVREVGVVRRGGKRKVIRLPGIEDSAISRESLLRRDGRLCSWEVQQYVSLELEFRVGLAKESLAKFLLMALRHEWAHRARLSEELACCCCPRGVSAGHINNVLRFSFNF